MKKTFLILTLFFVPFFLIASPMDCVECGISAPTYYVVFKVPPNMRPSSKYYCFKHINFCGGPIVSVSPADQHDIKLDYSPEGYLCPKCGVIWAYGHKCPSEDPCKSCQKTVCEKCEFEYCLEHGKCKCPVDPVPDFPPPSHTCEMTHCDKCNKDYCTTCDSCDCPDRPTDHTCVMTHCDKCNTDYCSICEECICPTPPDPVPPDHECQVAHCEKCQADYCPICGTCLCDPPPPKPDPPGIIVDISKLPTKPVLPPKDPDNPNVPDGWTPPPSTDDGGGGSPGGSLGGGGSGSGGIPTPGGGGSGSGSNPDPGGDSGSGSNPDPGGGSGGGTGGGTGIPPDPGGGTGGGTGDETGFSGGFGSLANQKDPGIGKLLQKIFPKTDYQFGTSDIYIDFEIPSFGDAQSIRIHYDINEPTILNDRIKNFRSIIRLISQFIMFYVFSMSIFKFSKKG